MPPLTGLCNGTLHRQVSVEDELMKAWEDGNFDAFISDESTAQIALMRVLTHQLNDTRLQAWKHALRLFIF